jgi:predicted ATPase/DNA-binding CsgD family transcriptional regulator/orotidine-5'-phosphate decarboxylase
VAHNLPAALSSFVGRHEEMAAVAKLLDGARLVTLVGPAGVGKTRLALQVASTASQLHDEAASLAQLAPVDDPSLVAAAVAAALGVRERPGRSRLQALISDLSSRRLLLVLDNCEHVIGGAAALAEGLLGACPELRILATSRQALGVDGEAAWPVRPLSVPPARQEWGADELTSYEAVRLFVERATSTEPSFALNGAAPAVAEICRRLDGIPLAIELAAARVGVLAPAEIAARLDDRFRLLSAGSRTAAPRHQSLQAALEWSYDLLCDPERMLLGRLSVFAGGFTLEAAEDVCAADGLQTEDVLHLLAGLAAKSLVVADTSGEQARYRLLETIRHYGADKLAAAGETQALGDRHAAYYTRLAELAEPELTEARQGVWIERLDAEHANLRAALGWGLTCGQREQALRLATMLTLFWVRGYFSEGRAWLDQTLAANPDACPPLRAKALWVLGGLAIFADDYAAAVASGKESLALYRKLGDIQGVARALQVVGVSMLIADPAEGRPMLRESVALARQAGDRWCLTGSLGLSGLIESYQGNLAAARPALEECLALAREAHDGYNVLLGLLGLGAVAFQEGDHRSAEALLGEGLAVAREVGTLRWTSLALVLLGTLARIQGGYARARILLDEGLALGRESGSLEAVALALHAQGGLSRAEGELDAAGRLFAEALALAQTAGGKVIAAWVLLDMSELHQTKGDLDACRARIDEALAVATDSGSDHVVAQALHRRGQLSRLQGDRYQAETSHHQALRLWDQTGQRVGVAATLEALGGLAADDGRAEHAARLFAAAQAFREGIGYVRPPAEQAAYDADVVSARQGLSPEAFAAAWEEGLGLSLTEAVAYAAKGRGPRQRPTTGWASLTKAERDVALLAAEGMTNTEIGQRLFISPRTAKAHLAHIFAKLGITSRRELPREGQPGT